MKPIGTSILNLGCAVALPLVGLALAAPAYSQGEDASFLEEIVVVAQKREQNLMDVPVAITAITGAQIEQSGIKDMIDLQQNVPGLIVGGSQTTTTTNFSIRGIGSTSNNFGVESSVGLYVDGVYRSRQSSLINELVDVQAVEVLRGPQGTLFGKNTASGAINVRTVAPSTEGNDAFVEVTAGDYGLARVAAATNIVLSDKLAFRGTLFTSKRDGYVTDDNVSGQISTALGPVKDLYNDRDRIGMRMQLAYDNLDDFNMRVIADYAEIDEVCCIGTTRVDSIFSRGGLAAGMAINGPDAILMSLGGTVYTDQNYPFPLPPNVIQANWDDYRTSLNFAPVSQNEDRGISVEMNKILGNGSTFTSVSAFRAFDTYDSIDADFTDTSIAERTNEATQQSFSQEFRLAGEFGDSNNWVVGAYYFAQDIDSNTVTIGGTQLQTYADLGNAAQGLPTLSEITNGVTAISIGYGWPYPAGRCGLPARGVCERRRRRRNTTASPYSARSTGRSAMPSNYPLALATRMKARISTRSIRRRTLARPLCEDDSTTEISTSLPVPDLGRRWTGRCATRSLRHCSQSRSQRGLGCLDTRSVLATTRRPRIALG